MKLSQNCAEFHRTECDSSAFHEKRRTMASAFNGNASKACKWKAWHRPWRLEDDGSYTTHCPCHGLNSLGATQQHKDQYRKNDAKKLLLLLEDTNPKNAHITKTKTAWK